MDKMRMHTPDITEDNIEKIGQLFPNCLTERIDEHGEPEMAIDFDMLRQELSKEIVEGPQERYQFTWPDKKKAIRLANAPTNMTLRPCREESVDFNNTENLYIEGDNLEVLKLLREDYLGKVKMIYIDPPYNTGNDFVYEDDYSQDTSKYVGNSGQLDEAGNRLVQNTESNGRFHTDWLNMLYPRIRVARDLLTQDGAIFISIDDNEQENLKKVCDEVFGEVNYIGKIAVVNNLKGRNDKKDIATCHEYLIIYGKSEFAAGGMPLSEEQRDKYDRVDEKGNAYQLRDLRKRGRPDRREDRPNMFFPIYFNETTKECSLQKHEGWIEIFPLRGDNSDGRWRWGRERVQANLSILEPKYSSIAGRWGIQHRVYLNPSLNPASSDDDDDDNKEERYSKSKSFWMGGNLSSDVGRRQLKTLFGSAFFDYPKSVDFIKNVLYMGSDLDSTILDFFSGSSTTAEAVMSINSEDQGKRRFIMVQLPEATDCNSEAYKAGYVNISEIGKERIRRAGKKIIEEQRMLEVERGLFAQNETTSKIDIGFRVLKLASSNMEDVYYRPEDSSESTLFEDNIKPDRTGEDLLFQVMLECNLPLSAKIQTEKIAGKEVFSVNNGYLIACFDEDVNEEVITAVAKRKPYYFIMRDKSLSSDNVADNFEQIFQAYSKETIRRII